MNRLLYLTAEAVVLYIVTLILGGIICAFVNVIDAHWVAVAFSIYAVALIPWSIIAATVGTRFSLTRGFYQPIRLIAFLAPAVAAYRNESTAPAVGHRMPMHFTYKDNGELRAYDVVSALSDHLRRIGVAHRNVGGLSVEDNDTTWWLEADMQNPVLNGWVQAEDARDRAAVVSAIRAFLTKDLRLSVAG